MDVKLKNFVVYSKEDALTVAIINSIDVDSPISRQNFIDKFINACKVFYGEIDIVEIVDPPEFNVSPPYIKSKIEYLLQEYCHDFDLHIIVDIERCGHILNIQETCAY